MKFFKSMLVCLVLGFSSGIVISVAYASLTFTSSSITGDSGFTNLTGAATTTIDVGVSTLNLQTTNNGPIKFGTGPIIFSGITGVMLATNGTGNVVATSGFVSSLGNTTGSIAIGNYLSGGATLNVSSTLASSTINLIITNPTTTAPSYTKAVWDYQRKFTNIGCVDAAGTTTLVIYNTTSITTTTQNALIVSPTLTCGVAGNATTTFVSSTLLANYALLVQVTSTAGTPTMVNVYFNSLKQ